jgi:DnaK suppressor protein
MDRATDTGRDSIDQSTSEGMLSTDLRLRDREKKLLGKIRGAVTRLDEGSIDECEDCGEPIGFKRLLARPVTTLCIHCKENREELERREASEVVMKELEEAEPLEE